MNKLFTQLIFSVMLLFSLYSCHNAADNKKDAAVNSEQLTAEINKNQAVQHVEKVHPGKEVFTKYCLTCHQADGSGVPNMHPPLTPGSWIDKEPAELIAIMMKGLTGKIEVNGEVYKNFMPSQAQLTDEEIANVLSYVRSSFGNNSTPVTPDMVKKIRSGR